MKKILGFIIFIFVFLIGFLIIQKYRSYVKEKTLGNGLANTYVVWSNEWKTIRGHDDRIVKTAMFGGSEFRADIIGASSFAIQASTTNTDSDTQLVVSVNKKKYILQNPDINKRILVVSFTPQGQKEKNTIDVRFFCTGMFSPCSINIVRFHLSSGKFLPVQSPAKKTLAVLGDSISLIDVSRNYTALLAESLNFHLHNASAWGGTLGSKNGKAPAILRYEGDIIAYHPNVILIALGINDIKNTHSTLPDFISDYGKMVTDIKTNLPGAKILLLGILNEKDETTDENTIDTYNSAIATLADNNTVVFINSKDWLPTNDYLDQYHPTEMGQKILFVKLQGYIMQNKLL